MNLIADTGIQFHTIRLDLGEDIQKFKRSFSEEQRGGKLWLVSALRWVEEDIMIDRSTIEAERLRSECDFDATDLDRALVKEVDPSLIYTMRGGRLLSTFEKRWIPIPYFRKRFDVSRPYFDGPFRWCRGYLTPCEKPQIGHSHDLVLAFDTSGMHLEPEAQYELLRPDDASRHGENSFGFVSDDRFLEPMYRNRWFQDWLTHEWERTHKKYGQHEDRLMEPLAGYLVLLGMLQRAVEMPEIKVFRQQDHIEVSLVLDVGNSRTCGVLMPFSKVDENPLDISKMRALELRNLGRPNVVSTDPFDMQLTFCEERFSDDTLGDDINRIGLGRKIFYWPSVVRLGEEGHALAKGFQRQDGVASMSSPKRYLWDEAKTALPWRKVRKHSGMAPSDEYVNHGVADCWDERGRFLFGDIRKDDSSHYCRSSLMSMALVEVLLQAISQLNSYVYRREMGNEPFLRKLKHLVLTCPTAMPRTEQIKLREAADHAIRSLRMHYPGDFWPDQVEIVPSYQNLRAAEDSRHQEWSFDEATCSQIAFMYGELVHKMGRNATEYFRLRGRSREWQDGAFHTLRLASLDIGGGTSDMMICDYRNKPGFEGEVFPQVRPVFWEGFATAGDDIARSIIERIILPSIKHDLEAQGGRAVEETVNVLFGPSMGTHTQEDKVMKRWFTHRVALPVAYGILKRRADQQELGAQDLGSLAPLELESAPEMKAYFERQISSLSGVSDFDFQSVHLLINEKEVDDAVRIVMKRVLGQMAALIASFKCDMVLLTGRPSRLQAVRDMMDEWMPVSPESIVCMGDLSIGNWYPFADALERISDPKTTVVVGAAIAHLCKHRKLEQFQLDAEYLRQVGSTARFIGVLQQGRSEFDDAQMVVTPDRYEGKVQFSGSEVILGYRQMQSDQWLVAPLYRLGYVDDGKQAELEARGFELPYTILIERNEEDGLERLRRGDVEDAKGDSFPFAEYLTLRLHTMRESEGYWRDTGYFNLDFTHMQS